MKGVHVIFIDNKPVNALSKHVVRHIYKELDRVEKDDQVRIVLICGKNGLFSAGADIVELSNKADSFKTSDEAIWSYVDAYRTYNLAPLVYRIDSFPKPVVAFISGSALGGGLELAMGCHYRIAMESCTFSLPEVRLGIIPGALGTQLLPRLVDFKNCIDLCVHCKSIAASKALDIGLIDQIIRKSLNQNTEEEGGEDVVYNFENCLERTLLLLEKQVLRGKDAPSPFRRTSSLLPVSQFAESLPLAYQVCLGLPSPSHGGSAARAAVRCLLSCLKAGAAFESGALEESEMSKVLVASSESKAFRYVFLSERLLQKLPTSAELRECQSYFTSFKSSGISPIVVSSNNTFRMDSLTADIGLNSTSTTTAGMPFKSASSSPSKFKFTVAVIGSGQMGTGIAVSILMSKSCSVVLIDTSSEALEKAKLNIGGILAIYMQRGRIDPEMATRLHRDHLVLSTSLSEVASCDVVIEAVFESVDIKTKLFNDLNELTNESCILCTNTSSLDIDAITSVVRNKSRIAGLHFFSPAHIMKLVEVVITKKTSLATVQKLMSLVKTINKVGVLATDLPGFIGNRMIFNYVMESMLLLEEGYSVSEVDSAMTVFGFPMGPCQMQDLSGLDIGYKIRSEKGLVAAAAATTTTANKNAGSACLASNNRILSSRYSSIGDELYLRGRLGVKNSRGFYNYPAMPSAANTNNKSFLQKLVDNYIANSNFKLVNRFMDSAFFPKPKKKKGGDGKIKSDFKGLVNSEVVEIINIVRSRSLRQRNTNDGVNRDRSIRPSSSSNSNSSNDDMKPSVKESSLQESSAAARKEEIIARLLLPLINEGFKLLSEGGVVSFRPSDVDMVYIYGFGFPAYKGGPLYYAENTLGLEYTLNRLREYNTSAGGTSNCCFEPSVLLEKMVTNGVSLKDLQQRPYVVRELMLGRNISINKMSKL